MNRAAINHLGTFKVKGKVTDLTRVPLPIMRILTQPIMERPCCLQHQF